jgi:sugar phosphate isomerase/epimerase
MAKPKIGVQLIVYGGRDQTDFAGVVKEVAEAGYDGVEIAFNFKDRPADEIKGILADNNLELTGIHAGYGNIADMKSLEEGIAFLNAVGGKYLICSGVAEGEGLAAYENAAETFNKVGRVCAPQGVQFLYHNHAFEFETHDGKKGMHRLCQLIDPSVVKLCVDVYWVAVGGEKPEEFVPKYKHIAEYFHIKDGAPGSFIELGKGSVDLKAAVDAVLPLNPEWLVVEQDRTELEPKDSIRQSLEYLKTLL